MVTGFVVDAENDTVGGLPKDHSCVIDVGMTKTADFLQIGF